MSRDDKQDERLRARGVSRDYGSHSTLNVAFNREVTDDELRAIHDLLRDLPDWVKQRTVDDFFRCLDSRVIPPIERRDAIRALATRGATIAPSSTARACTAPTEEIRQVIGALGTVDHTHHALGLLIAIAERHARDLEKATFYEHANADRARNAEATLSATGAAKEREQYIEDLEATVRYCADLLRKVHYNVVADYGTSGDGIVAAEKTLRDVKYFVEHGMPTSSSQSDIDCSRQVKP